MAKLTASEALERRREVLATISATMADRDISKNQLADASGIDRGNLARVLNGRVQPTEGTLLRLRMALEELAK